MNYYFDPHARQELRDATLHFDGIDPALGRDFADEVERIISLVLRFPEAWPRVTRSVRRCRTQRFPYALLYRVWDEQIEILAVMHLSRKPGYWADRLRE
jgi:plasmid stabilization system protein ParE